jgi:hypothetical protein
LPVLVESNESTSCAIYVVHPHGYWIGDLIGVSRFGADGRRYFVVPGQGVDPEGYPRRIGGLNGRCGQFEMGVNPLLDWKAAQQCIDQLWTRHVSPARGSTSIFTKFE